MGREKIFLKYFNEEYMSRSVSRACSPFLDGGGGGYNASFGAKYRKVIAIALKMSKIRRASLAYHALYIDILDIARNYELVKRL